MRRAVLFRRRLRAGYIVSTIIAMMIVLLIIPFTIPENIKGVIYHVEYEGELLGVARNIKEIEKAILDSRVNLAKQSEGMTFVDVEFDIVETYVDFAKIDPIKYVQDNIYKVMLANKQETLEHSYTIKINDYTANLSSAEEIVELLSGSIAQYDTEGEYEVVLSLNNERKLNTLEATVKSIYEEEKVVSSAGIGRIFEEIDMAFQDNVIKDFDDYDLGIRDIYFANEVEIVESYLLEEHMSSLESAIEDVTKKLEKQEIYEVVSGDTLSGISIKTDVPLDKLIELNDNLEDENSLIRIGDELIITIPEPELTVMRYEQTYIEEDYEADVVYIDNDDWFTTDEEVIQQPSSGHRTIIANTVYRNDKETDREIIKEEITFEAVAKIVEKGTIIPPTFIKPISGGRLTSPFGPRRAPTAGASTYHGGIDWATPIGTAVFASSGGKVTRAGWGGGYGYVVYVSHPNGIETRYAHCSRVLVSAGQYVSQGQKIALSGSTGVSSGPHIHFEMRLHGKKVNPASYL